MDQEQYKKETKERNRKLDILSPMCSWGKTICELSKKNFFMRREWDRIMAIQGRAEAEMGL